MVYFGRVLPDVRRCGIHSIEYAIYREREEQFLYRSYARITKRESIRKLLAFMIDQEKRHERMLTDYFRDGTGTVDLGPADSVPGLDTRSESAAEFDPDMSVTSFLRLAAEREQASVRMYEVLSAQCASAEGEALMRELSAEERKHGDWIEQRRELEVLG